MDLFFKACKFCLRHCFAPAPPNDCLYLGRSFFQSSPFNFIEQKVISSRPLICHQNSDFMVWMGLLTILSSHFSCIQQATEEWDNNIKECVCLTSGHIGLCINAGGILGPFPQCSLNTYFSHRRKWNAKPGHFANSLQ